MKLPNKKMIYRIVLLIVTLGALAFMTFNEYGILRYMRTKKELNQIDADIRKSEERIKAMEGEIDSLKSSKEKLERVAREKFNMMKKNEKEFKIEVK